MWSTGPRSAKLSRDRVKGLGLSPRPPCALLLLQGTCSHLPALTSPDLTSFLCSSQRTERLHQLKLIPEFLPFQPLF